MRICLRPAAVVLSVVMAQSSSAQMPTENYEQWRGQVFNPSQLLDPAVSGPGANPDGDSLTNWLEYAFDADPLSPSADSPPLQIEWRGEEPVAVYSQRIGTDDLYYSLEGTPDLSLPWSLRNPDFSSEYQDLGHMERGWFRQPFRSSDYPRYFWRLRVFHPDDADWELHPPGHLSVSGSPGVYQQADGLYSYYANRLDWSDRSIVESGYRIHRRTLPEGSWELIAELPRDTTLYRDLDLPPSTAFEYRVSVAADYGGEELFSNPASAPPTAADSDGDGIPDVLELGGAWRGAPGTFPTSPHSANSGPHAAPDGWWARHGLDAFCSLETDTDGDGRPDWIEYLHGTNPLAAEERPNPALHAPSRLELETGNDGLHTLRWPADGSGRWTLVERSADGQRWQIIAVLPSTATSHKDTTSAPNALRFYRLVALD